MNDLKSLSSVDDVIKALGGTKAVQTLTEAKSPQVVWNWRSLGRFASHTYLILTSELERRGFSAASELWGITPPTEVPAAPHRSLGGQ